MSWQDDALCSGHEGDLWFTSEPGRKGKEQTDRAKAICSQCPSQTDCLLYAVTENITDGIWGGTTPSERGMTEGLPFACPECSRSFATKTAVTSHRSHAHGFRSPHGTVSHYVSYKCRCQPCRDAWAAEKRRERAS